MIDVITPWATRMFCWIPFELLEVGREVALDG